MDKRILQGRTAQGQQKPGRKVVDWENYSQQEAPERVIRMAMRIIAIQVLLLGAMFASAHAAPPKDLVKTELLSDVSAVQPGTPFSLGVRFKIEPGWHIYW